MDMSAKTKRETKVYSRPGIDSTFYVESIPENTNIRITGIKRIGIKTFYLLKNGNYVFGDDIQITRDMDFYYKNYSSKHLLKNNLSINGEKGSNYVLESGKSHTSTYALLESITGGDFGEFKEISSYVPTNSGGGLIPSSLSSGALRNTSSMNILPDQNQSDLFSVGNILSGDLITGLSTDFLGNLGTWFSDKLKYVIGFDLSSWGGSLSEIFSSLWNKYASKIFGKFASILGGLLFGWNMSTDGGLFGNSFDGALENSNTWAPQYIFNKKETGFANGTLFNSLISAKYVNGEIYFSYNANFEGNYISRYDTSGWFVPNDWSKELEYAPVTQEMLNYFSFYLTDEVNSTKKIAAGLWGPYESYNTGTAEAKKSEREIQFFKDMHPEDYHEVEDAMSVIKNEFNIGIERETIVTKFNRFRVPTMNNELTSTRGYVFFTKPDLNLEATIYDSDRNVKQSYSHYVPLFYNMIKSHSVLMKYLTGGAVDSHMFIPILTDRCTGIDVSDEIIETVEHGLTRTGWKFMYGTSTTKSKTAGTVNVTFTDDNMISVYKILKVWVEYINGVYKGELSPKAEYLKKHILDYATSIYYILTNSTGDDIIFFTKFTGCFPTSVPSSNFSDVLGTPIKRPNYTIPFTYSRKDDYNPLHLAEFNHLSTAPFQYIPIYNEKTMHVGPSFVGAPFVDTLNGSYLFKLRFRPDSSNITGQSAPSSSPELIN